MFMCFTKWSPLINSNYSGQQPFSYTSGQSYKTFTVVIYEFFVISKSVSPWQTNITNIGLSSKACHGQTRAFSENT